jgi:hypothetical protein
LYLSTIQSDKTVAVSVLLSIWGRRAGKERGMEKGGRARRHIGTLTFDPHSDGKRRVIPKLDKMQQVNRQRQLPLMR